MIPKRLKNISAVVKEATYAYKTRQIRLQERINVRFDNLSKFPEGTEPIVETSMGRIFFNEVLPEKLEFYNEPVDQKTSQHDHQTHA